MIIALIPARSGSKRIPNKNIVEIGGKPLLSWTISAALKSNIFEKVFVSTDSTEIKKIAESFGAIVPKLRSKELSTDLSSTAEVVRDFVSDYEASESLKIQTLCLLQPTSPLRDEFEIIEAFDSFKNLKADAIVSVNETSSPTAFINFLPKNNSMQNFINPEKIRRTQEYQKEYEINGAIYFMNREISKNMDLIYKSKTFAHVMPKYKSLDIDDFEDINIANKLIR